MRPHCMNSLSNEAHIKLHAVLRSSGENKGLQKIPQWCLGNAPSLTPHPLYKCQMRLKEVEMQLKEKALGRITHLLVSARLFLPLPVHTFTFSQISQCGLLRLKPLKSSTQK